MNEQRGYVTAVKSIRLTLPTMCPYLLRNLTLARNLISLTGKQNHSYVYNKYLSQSFFVSNIKNLHCNPFKSYSSLSISVIRSAEDAICFAFWTFVSNLFRDTKGRLMKFDGLFIITETSRCNAKVGICCQFQLKVISGSWEIKASESFNAEVITGGFVVLSMFTFSFPERLKAQQNY